MVPATFSGRSTSVLWLFIVLSLSLTLPGWAETDTAESSVDPAFQTLPRDMTQLWTYDVTGGGLGMPLSTPRWVYLAAADGYVHALDAQTGIMRWKYKATAPIDMPLTLAGEVMYAVDRRGCTLALARHSGIQRWKFLAKSRPVAPVSAGFGVALVATADGTLVALSPRKGRVRWRYRHDQPIAGQPGENDGAVLLLGEEGLLVWLDPKRGQPLRQVQLPGWFVCGLSTGPGQVFAVDLQSRVWSLSGTGDVQWVFTTVEGDKPFARSPLLAGSLLLAPAEDRTLFGLSCDGGERLWRFTARSSLIGKPARSLDQLILATGDGRVVVLDQETGRKAWELDGFGPLTNGPVWSHGKLLLTVAPTRLIALGTP